MFQFLKNKIGEWTKKISKEEAEAEKPAEKPSKERETKKSQKKDVIVESKKGKLKPEEEFEPGQGFFSKIREKIQKTRISEKEFEEYSGELENILLENNVALEVAEKIIKELKEEIVGKELSKKEIELQIKNSLKATISNILVEPYNLVDKIKEKKEKPYIVLFSGVNGSGKTTTIAKIAYILKKEGISSVIAAGDTFRAASIEQLKKHGEKLGIEIISHDYGSDPASVGFDAIKYAKKNSIDCVLIDTAGRMHTAKNLLREMEKIVKVTKPDLKIFIGESITGNDSVEQVRSFDEAIGIDGIILSKADIDEKGGTALSLGYVSKKPILYLGTGQDYDNLELFDKNKFIEKLGL